MRYQKHTILPRVYCTFYLQQHLAAQNENRFWHFMIVVTLVVLFYFDRNCEACWNNFLLVTGLSADQMLSFRRCLEMTLVTRYRDHWFPDRPQRGSAYRCVRIVNRKLDRLLASAASAAGVPEPLLERLLPTELTLWVDPDEVLIIIKTGVKIIWWKAESVLVFSIHKVAASNLQLHLSAGHLTLISHFTLEVIDPNPHLIEHVVRPQMTLSPSNALSPVKCEMVTYRWNCLR